MRYFGGIKLGAGGLIRAYSSAASDALSAADKIVARPMDVYKLKTDFAHAKRFTAFALRNEISIVYTEYSAKVTFTLAVESGRNVLPILSDALQAKPDLNLSKRVSSSVPKRKNRYKDKIKRKPSEHKKSS